MAEKSKLHKLSRYIKRANKSFYTFFGMAAVRALSFIIDRARLWRYELTYKLHLRVRSVHDNLVIKVPVYRKVANNKYSRSIKNATVSAFFVSLIVFIGIQYISPYFNIFNPQNVQAGANSVTWTTKGDFENNAVVSGAATTRNNVLATGVSAADNASLTLANPEISFDTISLSAGTNYTLAIKTDGTLWAWGLNGNGQLGLGDTNNRALPTQIGTAANWKMVTTSADHTLAIKTDGTLWAWGWNYSGKLGLGDTSQRNAPVQVGTGADWKIALTGSSHSLAIKTDGTLWAWGNNNYGQLGLGDILQRTTPVRVGTATDWKSLAATIHTLAIKTDGTLWAWGYNGQSQLGLGDTAQRNAPVQVGSANDWKMVAVGNTHSLSIRTDGTLWSWGENSAGQLGLGDKTMRITPVQVGLATNWKIASGSNSTLAIKTDGTLWAWGYNASGQLGLGDTNERTIPFQVGGETNWKVADLSPYGASETVSNHAVAVKVDGSFWAWGYNNFGQLGLGDTARRSIPVQSGIASNWRGVSFVYPSSGNIAGLMFGNEPNVKKKWGSLTWNLTESLPVNTSISFQTRGTNVSAPVVSTPVDQVNPDLGWTSFAALTSVTSLDPLNHTGNMATASTVWVEVKMFLATTDGAATPAIGSFTITYDSLEAPANGNISLAKTDGNTLKSSSGATITAGTAGAYTNQQTLRVATTGLTCTGCSVSATNLRPEVEIKPIGTAFTGTGTVVAIPGSVYADVPALSAGASYHIQVRAVDDQGRASAWTSYGNNAENVADIIVDQNAPTGTVSINNAAQYATSTSVTLTNTAADTGGSGLSQMQFSNDETIWSDWEAYSPTKIWTLAAGDGNKTVYAQYKDNAGNVNGKAFTSQADWQGGTLSNLDAISSVGDLILSNGGGTTPNFGSGVDGVLVVDGTTAGASSVNGATISDSGYTGPFNSTHPLNIDTVISRENQVYNFTSIILQNNAIVTHTQSIGVGTAYPGIQLRATGMVTIDANSKIDVSGKGYLGGAAGADPNSTLSASNGNGPGGGTGAYTNSWDARYEASGGGYGGVGYAGYLTSGNATSQSVGAAYSTFPALGSGGGAGIGSTYCATVCETGSAGGNGGGSVTIVGNNVSLLGSIVSNGGVGGHKTYYSDPGAGGSGGSVYILTSNSAIDLSKIFVAGGGGNSSPGSGTTYISGAGGGGIVKVQSVTPPTNSPSIGNGIYKYVTAFSPNGTLGEMGTTLSIDAEVGMTQEWNSLSWSAPVLVTGQSVKFQVSTDGTNWLGPDGNAGSWSANYFGQVYGGSAYTNLTNIAASRYLFIKIQLSSSGNDTPVLHDLSIQSAVTASISLDTVPSPNIVGLAAYTDSGKATPILDTTWNSISAPYFEWTPNASDTVGYKYCFGTASCTPNIDIFNATSKTLDLFNQSTYPDNIYYMRVAAYDAAGNTSLVPAQYAYKLDRTTPGAVTGYSASQTYEEYIRVEWSPVSAQNGSAISYTVERIKNSRYQEGFTVNDFAGHVWAAESANGYARFEGITDNFKLDNIVADDRGIKYAYRIKSIDETGKESPFQNDEFFGLTRDGVPPSSPASVVVKACSSLDEQSCSDFGSPSPDEGLKGHEVKVSWAKSTDGGTGVQKYYIIRVDSVFDDSYTAGDIVSTLIVDPNNSMQAMVSYIISGIDDYTLYHYRVIAEDGSTPANKSAFMPSADENYGYKRTPDVTAPTTPIVSAAAAGMDDPMASVPKQKIVISWAPSTDTGAGLKSYRLYKANRADATDQSSLLTDGDFAELPMGSNVSCDMSKRECTETGLEDVTFYYYRVVAIDSDPYNNESGLSDNAYVKTLSSAVPSPPRGKKIPNTSPLEYEPFPYVYSVKGDQASTGSRVGKDVVIQFTGSRLKDDQPYLLKYEVYRSTDMASWSKFGADITPIRNNNDTDNLYTVTDTTATDATKYYYRVRAVGNNPNVSGGGESYSGIGNNYGQGWDITPDTTKPAIPAGGLDVKVRDTHPNEAELRNIITWKVLTSLTTPKRNGQSDFAKYLVRRETYNPTTNVLISDDIVHEETNMSVNYYTDVIGIAFAELKYKYYIQIVDNAATEYKYSDGAIINPFSNYSVREYSPDSIIPAKAKPVLVTPVVVSKVSVASANVSWTTDQDADSIVQFRPFGSTGEWMIDGTIGRTTTHNVKIVNLSPNTHYEYQIVSRNYLGNNIETTGILPELVTSGFNISPSTVTSTTSTTDINWTTNLDASSAFVEYQLQRQPGDEAQGGTAGVEPSALEASPRKHRVVVKGLRSSRTYTYKIKSISKDGYLSEYPGGEFANFKTKAFDSAQFTLAPASSNVAERNITATTAQIVWQTESPTTSWVDYSTTTGVYDNAAGNNDLVGTHVVVIEGLIPGTKYFYRVRVKDANEVEYTSMEYSFTAVLKPKISNMRVKDVTPYSVTISWDTNVDTETIINWGKTAAYGEKRGISGVSKVHEIKVDNLEDNQEYHYQILAKDETGNEVADEDKIIRTPLDKEGPKIENVKLDVLPMGESETTGQVIISWTTNKPATTLVEYDEGVIGGSYSKQSIEDKSLNTSHTVIVKDLKPATSYHYRIVSKDKRENTSVSQDYTFVTPTKEKSILQLIIKSLEDTFSWTRNLNMFFSSIGRRFSGR